MFGFFTRKNNKDPNPQQEPAKSEVEDEKVDDNHYDGDEKSSLANYSTPNISGPGYPYNNDKFLDMPNSDEDDLEEEEVGDKSAPEFSDNEDNEPNDTRDSPSLE